MATSETPDTRGTTRTPMRTCIGCRTRGTRDELCRVVIRPGADGEQRVVTPDVHGTLPGRGAWLHPTETCIQQARERRAFARAFRSSVIVPEDLVLGGPSHGAREDDNDDGGFEHVTARVRQMKVGSTE